MLFVLRCERAPSRTVRETDGEGVARTFWLWRDGAWAVATAQLDGTVEAIACEAITLALHISNGVTIVKADHAPLRPTLPVPSSSHQEAISGVLAKAMPSEYEEALASIAPSRKTAG